MPYLFQYTRHAKKKKKKKRKPTRTVKIKIPAWNPHKEWSKFSEIYYGLVAGRTYILVKKYHHIYIYI